MSRRSRAEKRLLEWAPYPRVLFAGDARALLAELREDSPARGVTVVPADGPVDREALADIAVVAVVETQRSAFAKAQRALESAAPHLAPDAIRVVLIVHGAARITKRLVAQLVSPEVLHQVALAIPGGAAGERSLRDRIGLALLDAAGIDVLRFGSITAGEARQA